MRLRLPLLVLVAFSINMSFAQFNCGADILHKRKLAEDSSYRRAFERSTEVLRQNVQKQKFSNAINAYMGMQAAVYTIPVVVHVIHTGDVVGSIYNPDDARITGAIAYLNSIYNGTMPGIQGAGDIGIQFVLATRDPNCNPTTGIDRIDRSGDAVYSTYGVALQTGTGISDAAIKNSARWDPSLYYNIYVVNKIDSKDGTSGTFIAGYAAFPGLLPDQDGTVMLATQMATAKKTLPHEIGHALSLYHPFEDVTDMANDPATCPPNTSCSITGDEVCDTDPILIPPGFVCRTGANNTCTSTPFTINTENNFMNYTTCFTLFTNDQRDRMQATMSLPSRASLAASWAQAGSYSYAFSSPKPASCTPVTNAYGTSNLAAGLLGVSVDNRIFSSSVTPVDGGYIDHSNNCLSLIPLTKNATYTFSTDHYAWNYEQVAAWIDFNDDGVFDNTTELIMYADDIPDVYPAIPKVSISFTVPSTAVTNKVLRMRVVEELATGYGRFITGACYNPYAGQAEDYPVYITSVLPAKWKYFRGKKQNADVLLQWATTGEQNTKTFEVERSVDGTHFSVIGEVATTNNAGGSVYSFTDKNAVLPVYFYRLKLIDKDENYIHSNIIVIREEEKADQILMSITNPFRNTIDMRFKQPLSSKAEILLLDAAGKIITRSSLNMGAQQTTIDISGKKIASGLYILQVRTGNTVTTRKIVKQ